MRLSIVVPSFNQGQFIAATLDSLVGEASEGTLEVIVQDAGSTDGTQEILERYKRHPFMHIFTEQDEGQSDALNRGFERCTGDVLGWLNSDDVLCAGAVARVLNAFSADPEVQLIYGRAYFVDECSERLGLFPTGRLTSMSNRHRCPISQPSTFFRRECYERCGPINRTRKYCMDYELWTKVVLREEKVAYLPAVLSCTRIHGDTKTQNGGLAFIEEIIEMQSALYGSCSPVWVMYSHARSGSIARIPGKLVRFSLAALKTVLRHPSLLWFGAYSLCERVFASVREKLA